nr:immunoglobulin heavy chain junction region [Mus musculus]
CARWSFITCLDYW